eukprot:GFYU01010447.1.p1 GENE.GFYU01010447.1~~GFYU01010447.1.p1  ORF type:complete len:393 (-),score=149.88 GFYU01010447.1:141-1265(-)
MSDFFDPLMNPNPEAPPVEVVESRESTGSAVAPVVSLAEFEVEEEKVKQRLEATKKKKQVRADERSGGAGFFGSSSDEDDGSSALFGASKKSTSTKSSALFDDDDGDMFKSRKKSMTAVNTTKSNAKDLTSVETQEETSMTDAQKEILETRRKIKAEKTCFDDDSKESDFVKTEDHEYSKVFVPSESNETEDSLFGASTKGRAKLFGAEDDTMATNDDDKDAKILAELKSDGVEEVLDEFEKMTATATGKTRQSSTSKEATAAGLFTAEEGTTKKKSTLFSGDGDDDDDDLFALASKPKTKAAAGADDDDLFSLTKPASSTTKAKATAGDDDDDLFALAGSGGKKGAADDDKAMDSFASYINQNKTAASKGLFD